MSAPRQITARARALALAAATAAALAGCGSSSTRTVTSKSTPPPAPAGATTSAHTPAPSTTTQTTTQGAQPTGSAGGSEAPGGTRTAPEPAFTEGEAKAGLADAEAVLHSAGYTPLDAAQYHEHQTLAVLLGRRSDASDPASSGFGEQAFFFLDGRFIGTDAKQPSASLALVSQGETEVALAYPLYRSGDALGAPSGGRAIVHFQLNDGKLQALDPIPPVASASAPSRR